MSVENCSRDVLVSRNSSQMALEESVSINVCNKLFVVLFIGIKYLLLLNFFGNANDM